MDEKWQIPLTSAGVLTLIVLIALLGIAGQAIAPRFQDPRTITIEEPLEKNTDLQLYSGEVYVYEYMYNGTPINIPFAIASAPTCTLILVPDNPGDPGVCVDEAGNDRTMSNASLEHPQIILFKPWMLALEPGWNWGTTMYLSYNGTMQEISQVDYRLVRMDSFEGRSAYVVKETTDGGNAVFSYIDVEKRVLLRLIGEGFEIDLKQAPMLEEKD